MRYKKLIIFTLLIFILLSSFVNAESSDFRQIKIDDLYFANGSLKWQIDTNDGRYYLPFSYSAIYDSGSLSTYVFLEDGKNYQFDFEGLNYLNTTSRASDIDFIVNNDFINRLRITSSSLTEPTILNYYYSANYTGWHNIKFHLHRQSRTAFKFYSLSSNVLERKLLEKPKLATNSTVRKISVNWNSISNATFYNVYLDDVLIDTVNSTTYIFDNLSHDTNYIIKVEPVDATDKFGPSFTEVSVKTKNYFVGYPTDVDSNVGRTWGQVFWNEIESTDYYELRLDGGYINRTTNLNYLFEGLHEDTEYIVEIRQKSLNGQYSDWTTITFRTLPPLEIPPDVPKTLTVINVGEDFIEVEVSENEYTDNYTFYLNGNLVITQTDRIYRFEGLNANTNYYIGVTASNKHGEGSRRSIMAKTLDYSFPIVTNVKTQPKNTSSGPIPQYNDRIQEISWQSKNVQEGYKVYIDGILIGEYDAGTNFAEINLDEIEGLEVSDSYEIEIVPLDADGKSYKLKFNTLTNNSNLNVMVEKLRSGINDLIRAGVILILLLLGICISFFGARFLYTKFKLWLATSTPDALEDTSDNVAQTDFADLMDQVDKSALNAERKAEKEHGEDSKDLNNIKLSETKEKQYINKINKEIDKLNKLNKKDLSLIANDMGVSTQEGKKQKTKNQLVQDIAIEKLSNDISNNKDKSFMDYVKDSFKDNDYSKQANSLIQKDDSNKAKLLEQKILSNERGEK